MRRIILVRPGLSRIFLILCLTASTLLNIYPASPDRGIDPLPDQLVYKTIDTVQLVMQFSYPGNMDKDRQYPAIIFFFGGGWKGGSIDQFKPQAAFFAERGMIAVRADYRVESRHGTTPFEAVKDAKSAIRFLREHARELQIDPQRIVASGGSAGGHLAAATGCVPGLEEASEDLSVSSTPDALVLFNPVFDNGPEGYGYERIGERYPEISPLHNIGPGSPPTIVFLGTEDRLIPVSTAEHYKASMEKAGNRCDLFLYEGEGHGFFNYRHAEYYRKTTLQAARFLESLGYLNNLALYDLNKIILAKEMAERGLDPFATALTELRLKADEMLAGKPVSVMDKKYIPPSGDKHDYYSLGPYWWPDPDKKDGLPYIRHDGKRNPEYAEYDGPLLNRMSEAVFLFSLAWVYTGERQYAEAASEWIRTWFLSPETRMNPHLEYGQAIPGITEGRGIGIIETDEFIDVVEAVDMLRGSGALKKEEDDAIVQWFKEYNHWLLTSQKGWDERRWHNNHGTSYDAQVAAFALFTGDDSTALMILDSVKMKRIDRHFEADGSQPFELERTKAMGYSIYNLLHHFRNAIMAERFGMDLWHYENPKGGSINKGVTYLIPFLTGEQEFPYEQLGGMEGQLSRLMEVLRMSGDRLKDPEIQDFIMKYRDVQKVSFIEELSFPMF